MGDLAGKVVGFQRATVSALRERPVAAAGWYFAYHVSHAAVFWVGRGRRRRRRGAPA